MFNVKRDFVQSFRLDNNIIYMKVGNENNYLEIPLPTEFNDKFIELNTLLEKEKMEFIACIMETQLMLSSQQNS